MRFAYMTLAAVLLASMSCAETIYITGNRPDSRGGFTTRKIAVDLGALDMNKSEDAPAILARLQDGISRICTPHEHIDFELAERKEHCLKHTLTDTLHSLKAPEISKAAGIE